MDGEKVPARRVNAGEMDRRREDVRIHILAVSAGLVGVDLTVLGITRAVIASDGTSSAVAKLLSLDSLLFLAACGLAYAAVLARSRALTLVLERAGNAVFLAGLVLMAAACGVIAMSLA